MNPKELLTKRIQKNIKGKNWAKLAEAMPITLEYPTSKSIQFRGWRLVGNYYAEQENFADAIKAYNKARVIKPSVVTVFDKMIAAADAFYAYSRDLFSKSDLQKLKEALLPVLNYHSVNFPKHRSIVETGKSLIKRINYRIKFEAADAVETKVTYPVHIIYDALYGDMTEDQVRNEFARLLSPILREKISEKEKSSKSEKKKNKSDKKESNK